jgi:hypothetical protein
VELTLTLTLTDGLVATHLFLALHPSSHATLVDASSTQSWKYSVFALGVFLKVLYGGEKPLEKPSYLVILAADGYPTYTYGNQALGFTDPAPVESQKSLH